MANGQITPRREADPDNQTNGKWCRADPTDEHPGGTCGNARIVGTTVCAKHGGSAPRVKAAAKRKQAEMQAMEKAARYLAEDPQASDPFEALVRRLRHASYQIWRYATQLEPLEEEAERQVEIGELPMRGHIESEWVEVGEFSGYMKHTLDPLIVASGQGFADHPWVRKLEYWCEQHAKYAKQCIDAGIEVRRLQIAENTVNELTAMLERSWDRLGLTQEQRQIERSHIAKDSLRLVQGGKG